MPALADDGDLDGSSCHERRADLDLLAFTDRQHLVDRDFGANFRRYLFYFDLLAGDDFVLLAASFYDRVHVDLSHK